MDDRAIQAAAEAIERSNWLIDSRQAKHVAEIAVQAYLNARANAGFFEVASGYAPIQVFNDLCRKIVDSFRKGQPVDDRLMAAAKVLEDEYEEVRAMSAASSQAPADAQSAQGKELQP